MEEYLPFLKQHFGPIYIYIYSKLKNKCAYLYKDTSEATDRIIGQGYDQDAFIQMNPENADDLAAWCEIVNTSYPDASYTPEQAKMLLMNHLVVDKGQTCFYVVDGKKLATISYGEVRTAADVGAFFRIAVLPDMQGHGIGTKLLLFAEDQLRLSGKKGIEEIIRLKRIPSLLMHFKVGYKPEQSYRERAWKHKSLIKRTATMFGYVFAIRTLTTKLYSALYENAIKDKIMENHKANGPYEAFIKRILDILISASVMGVFCWLYAVIAFLVRIILGSPVIFTQDRPGRIDPKTGKEKIFKLYKFRSMSNEKDENGKLLPDKDRLNSFGRLLRSTSLDELPEFYNIFKGDMSLIGPRPLLVKYLSHYNSFEKRRHELRPGLTGLAQISGRNAAAWKERFRKDVEYVDTVSFWLDVKIFFLTIKKVLLREGINYQSTDTITEYFLSEDRLK